MSDQELRAYVAGEREDAVRVAMEQLAERLAHDVQNLREVSALAPDADLAVFYRSVAGAMLAKLARAGVA